MIKTKIICTIGPASERPAVIRGMAEAGMDIARLNCSHGTHQERLRRLNAIRSFNKRRARAIAVLVDLEGPRIRVGTLRTAGLDLRRGQMVMLTGPGIKPAAGGIPMDFDGPLNAVRPGKHIYIDDGRIVLESIAATRSRVKARVVIPGTVKSRKGVNIPDANLEFRGLSDQDRADIAFGAAHRVEYIAQSFVRGPADLAPIRAILNKLHAPCGLIAKIENRQGIDAIESILDIADGIMVARGDMGICIPIYQVPIMQKSIIAACLRRKKFVITATQMLESMTENPLPTRAEVSDVANAVLDGTSAVMLSGETAIGRWPVQTVCMMNRILGFTEAHSAECLRLKRTRP